MSDAEVKPAVKVSGRCVVIQTGRGCVSVDMGGIAEAAGAAWIAESFGTALCAHLDAKWRRMADELVPDAG